MAENQLPVAKRRVLQFDSRSISDDETRFEIQIVQELNNLKEEFTKTSEEKESMKAKFLNSVTELNSKHEFERQKFILQNIH